MVTQQSIRLYFLSLNAGALFIGNSTVNTTINSTAFSGTAANANNLGGSTAASYATIAGLSSNVATLASNSTTYFGGLGFASYANNSAPVITTTLEVGAAGNNVTINTTAILLGNSTVKSTVNSTVYNGTANNATNLGGLASTSYANTSAPVITTTLEVGAAANAVTLSTTTVNIGNATVNSTINSTSFNATSNNSLYLGGTIAASYANTTNTSATNITAGTLPWAQAPAGTVNSSAAFTIAGVLTYSANLVLQSGLTANGGVGSGGQVLASNGTLGSPYWITLPGSGPIGSTTQIAYNNAGVESGDANLTWATASGLLTVGNTTVNAQINSTRHNDCWSGSSITY